MEIAALRNFERCQLCDYQNPRCIVLPRDTTENPALGGTISRPLPFTKMMIKKWKEHREDDGAFTRSLLHPKIIQLRVKLDRRRKSVISITIRDRKSEGGAKKWRVSRVKSL